MKQGRIALALVSMVLGVMVVTQYKMTQTIADGNLNIQRNGELALKITNLETERDALKKQLDTIKKQGTVEGVKEENDMLSFQAGLTNVEGPGVVLTISDSKVPVKDGENPNLYLIHDEDVLRIINELRAGGAEAIAINDQRIMATTEVRCAGPTITVNGKSFTPPFQVKAIGDPKLLKSSLLLRGGVVDSLKYWGIDVNIQAEQNMTIPAYKGAFKHEFMKNRGGEA